MANQETTNKVQINLFVMNDNYTITEKVTVERNTEGKLTLSQFAVKQLLLGAQLLFNNNTGYSKETLTKDQIRLVFRLTELSVYSEEIIEKVFRDFEVQILREFLEARMAHCEKEKEENNVLFNADTYVSMKLMLIDIREWQLGKIVIEELESIDIRKQEEIYNH